MLSPDSRAVAFDLLRPPVGYRLDLAVLTTYTLDLEALLILPLSVLAQPDGGLEELLADPLRLHQAIREAGDRIHAFVDETGIAIPRSARPLYSMLESSVHPVRAPGGGAFHAKAWVARFAASDGSSDPVLRVAILSRNLTFDRSWDIALSSESPLKSRRRVAASRPLGDFLLALPQLCTGGVAAEVMEHIQELADQVSRTAFPAPDGFESPVEFHALGLQRRRRSWRPPTRGYRTLAVAPFVNQTGLDVVGKLGGNDRTLVSRREELDKLPDDVLAEWKDVYVLADTAQGESEEIPADHTERVEGGIDRTSRLHAKLIAVEHGWNVTWYVGSANLTSAAFGGDNVELMASVTGKKGRKGGASGCGIDRFLEGGFGNLCVEYQRIQLETEDARVTDARNCLEAVQSDLFNADLRVKCDSADDLWRLTIDGTSVQTAPDIKVVAWPVSVSESLARGIEDGLNWRLPVACLTAFIAFRLSINVRGVEDIRMALRLPVEGVPEDRIYQVLRNLLDSPGKFLRFLKALLGGLDAVLDWAKEGREQDVSGTWDTGWSGDSLLEDLVRAASRDPARLDPVRRLIDDLRKTEEGRRIVPDELFAVWTAVEEALPREAVG